MSWSLQDAKNRFSAVVDAALAHRPQVVTRRGKPVVVILAASDFERLRRLDAMAAPGFKAHLRAGPPDPEQDDRPIVTPREIAF